MGILRVKENIEDIIERDPYELINLEEPHLLVRRLPPQYYGAIFVGVFVAFAAAFIAFYNASQQVVEQADSVHAYFEIKAIDSDGRPVAGATVMHDQEQVGTTDSFGEWRRFLRVVPGETYRVHLRKTTLAGELVAVKNLVVPAKIPENSDLELTGSVKMFFSERVKDQRRQDSGKSNDAAQAQANPVTDIGRDISSEVTITGVEPESIGKADLVAHNKSIWFVVDGTKSAILTDLVANLRRRSLELGLRVDPKSPFRLRLSVVGHHRVKRAAKSESVLIKAKGTYLVESNHQEMFSYLRNFQETPYQTARDILWALTVHVKIPVAVAREGSNWRVQSDMPAIWQINARYLTGNGGSMFFAAKKPDAQYAVIDGSDFPDVCTGTARSCMLQTAGIEEASPVFGWKRLTARVTGRVDDQTRIYVSGYEAQKTGERQISYWGIAGGQANLTVMQGEKVVLRKRVTHSDRLTINLPTSVISRR